VTRPEQGRCEDRDPLFTTLQASPVLALQPTNQTLELPALGRRQAQQGEGGDEE
jgi:hypothetical protein